MIYKKEIFTSANNPKLFGSKKYQFKEYKLQEKEFKAI